jgi:hypothetical protein
MAHSMPLLILVRHLDNLAYMRERMQAKRQGEAGKLSVYEQAILELSERENLNGLKTFHSIF